MFNLEQSISDWQRELSRAGLPPETVEELAAHLRDETSALMRSGMDTHSAFHFAQSRLGSPDSLRREFCKSNRARKTPVTIILGLWIAAAIAFSLYALFKIGAERNPGWQLITLHVITLTVGYVAAGIAGSLGIVQVVLRLLNRLTPSRHDSLIHGLKVFNRLAVVLVAVSLCLGFVWSTLHPLYYRVPPSDAHAGRFILHFREYACIIVCLWLTATMLLQKMLPTTEPALVPMNIIGNILVGFAWFGPFIFWSDLRHFYSYTTLWPVQLIMALHLIFLGLAFTRRTPLQSHPLTTDN